MDIDSIKKLNPKPRIHGNGFIQLDVSDQRLHIWHPNLPRQEVPTQIHNHRFGFVSQVLLGRQLNICYDVWYQNELKAGTHLVYQVQTREGEDTILVPMADLYCTINIRYSQVIPQGYAYQFSPLDYHESAPLEHTATLMTKTISINEFNPTILCRKDQEPDNNFQRYEQPQDLIWEIVEETLKKCENI